MHLLRVFQTLRIRAFVYCTHITEESREIRILLISPIFVSVVGLKLLDRTVLVNVFENIV